MPTKQKPNRNLASLAFADPSVPFEHKKRMLYLMMESGPEGDEVLQNLFGASAAANGKVLESKKLKELDELLAEMNRGLVRSEMFDCLLDQNGSVPRARLLLEAGGVAYCPISDQELAKQLRCGDMVLIESHGKAVLGFDPNGTAGTGEIAKLEQCYDDGRVRVQLRDNLETALFRATATLSDKLKKGIAQAGCEILVHPQRKIALDVVPASDGLAHYRFLVRDPVPDVRIDRDIGSPARFILELKRQLWEEMEPASRARRRCYRLRRSSTKLLYGVSGTGKTLSVQAVWRLMYEVISERTGIPIDQLPPRVLRLRSPQFLSHWLGQSDKLLDRFFDEVEQLAGELLRAPDGSEYELPVLVICEEVDAWARTRGHGDPIYDRIETTALERLDTNYGRLKDKLVIFLCTTNVPHLVDAAFLRRAGGTAERFGRLDRRGFAAVLSKHVAGLPCADHGAQHQAERRVVRQVTDWLYSCNGHDPGVAQLFYVGSTTPDVKHRRDFLTGALVDRAVQQAAAEACRADLNGCHQPGVTAQLIITALDLQIRTIADQLTEHNADNYLTLPDAARVGRVQRIVQPTVSPLDI